MFFEKLPAQSFVSMVTSSQELQELQMPLVPLSFMRSSTRSESPETVRQIGREDVLWNRPIFKAPPLEFSLTHTDVQAFAEDVRKVGLGER
jgi:hypothetical protein